MVEFVFYFYLRLATADDVSAVYGEVGSVFLSFGAEELEAFTAFVYLSYQGFGKWSKFRFIMFRGPNLTWCVIAFSLTASSPKVSVVGW